MSISLPCYAYPLLNNSYLNNNVKACSKGEQATRASYKTRRQGQVLCDISYTEANLFDMASVEAGVKDSAFIVLKKLLVY